MRRRAMLEGRGSMIAASKYKNASGDKGENNQYEVRASRFGQRSPSAIEKSKMNTNGKGFGCGIAWISRMVDMFLSINITCLQRRSGVLSADVWTYSVMGCSPLQ